MWFFNKEAWLDLAEVFDSLRLYPRLLLTSYSYLVWITTDWYFNLPFAQRTVDVTAFTGGVFGMATYAIKVYLDGGRNWDNRKVCQ